MTDLIFDNTIYESDITEFSTLTIIAEIEKREYTITKEAD